MFDVPWEDQQDIVLYVCKDSHSLETFQAHQDCLLSKMEESYSLSHLDDKMRRWWLDNSGLENQIDHHHTRIYKIFLFLL